MKVSQALMARVGRIIDPTASWDAAPINEYQQRRLDRAKEQVMAVLAAVSFADGDLIPDDVRDLVIAARVVAFEDQGHEAIRALDKASEAFADRIPWEDEPEAEPEVAA